MWRLWRVACVRHACRFGSHSVNFAVRTKRMATRGCCCHGTVYSQTTSVSAHQGNECKRRRVYARRTASPFSLRLKPTVSIIIVVLFPLVLSSVQGFGVLVYTALACISRWIIPRSCDITGTTRRYGWPRENSCGISTKVAGTYDTRSERRTTSSSGSAVAWRCFPARASSLR